jgi:hypothetical protein
MVITADAGMSEACRPAPAEMTIPSLLQGFFLDQGITKIRVKLSAKDEKYTKITSLNLC